MIRSGMKSNHWYGTLMPAYLTVFPKEKEMKSMFYRSLLFVVILATVLAGCAPAATPAPAAAATATTAPAAAEPTATTAAPAAEATTAAPAAEATATAPAAEATATTAAPAAAEKIGLPQSSPAQSRTRPSASRCTKRCSLSRKKWAANRRWKSLILKTCSRYRMLPPPSATMPPRATTWCSRTVRIRHLAPADRPGFPRNQFCLGYLAGYLRG